jgi:flavin reductase (DIM6/NTAB) family NADH-FMN oxidoreductase RutF
MSAALAQVLPAEHELDDERRDFIRAMRAAVTGVSVVTTDGVGGRLGRTVSALASVSADPAMLLVCIARRSPLVAAIRTNAVFGVNVLGRDQAALAETFAGRASTRFDFGAARWDAGATGVPLLSGAAARFDCVVASTVEAGTHTVIVGDVLAAEAGAAPPLAYVDGAYAIVARAQGSGAGITPAG